LQFEGKKFFNNIFSIFPVKNNQNETLISLLVTFKVIKPSKMCGYAILD